jgi:prepilin-type N-terminal cleavage/methylation domain-containing protein
MYQAERSEFSGIKLPRRKRLLGFTLVELIVVITILAILGTIGFLSIQGYSASARDGSRIGNLVNLQK